MCECGKSYLSQPALNNHKKSKHPESYQALEKRGRGRPRKYVPNPPGDFEATKYEPFFNDPNRAKPENSEPINLKKAAEDAFKQIYMGEHKTGLINQASELKDVYLLNLLYEGKVSDVIGSKEDKKSFSCDRVFYQYLWEVKEKTNERYFTLLLKFIILFRECFNKVKQEGAKDSKENFDSAHLTPESLPEMCNDFYTDFMDKNDFFGIIDQDRQEIIELIQHFCIWLYKNDYTKSKLSLAS